LRQHRFQRYDVAHAEVPKRSQPFRRIVATQLAWLAAFSQGLARESDAPTLGLRITKCLKAIQLMKEFLRRLQEHG